MFIGNYAPALALAGTRRGPGLATLFVAAQFVDIAFFSFVLTGTERMRETPGHTVMNAIDLYHMPYTHSLIGTLGFAALWALLVRLRRGTWRMAAIGAAVVASHWLLDLLVHAPDLTLAGIGRRYGLGLWNHPAIEMPLELGLVALAIVVFASRTASRGAIGRVSLATLIAALLAFQLVNWATPQPATVVDPVPASLPLTALLAYAVLAALAWWVQATRVARAGPAVSSL
ncbi:hypothetical protein ASG29_05270 [Sphingomonas sp. Leaf412]|uniref:hypothetical protein n=1 Tax=Sphingomonas sp. Leaf412 TaxID=1736370 RepID=UPI000700296E|nr:hypothetical protein [Sphingomonas sp. Leaf412]KQT33459.1 hypothetical protein ASG29_05270 [Sphingomonas sp. Leaf412]